MPWISIKRPPRLLTPKHDYKPHIPDFIPLHARKLEGRVEWFAASGAGEYVLRVRGVEGEEGGCAVGFLGGGYGGVETECCYTCYRG